jgi:thiamine-monophosphate kinase
MEEALIKLISNTITDSSYLGDDCAVIKIAGEDYLFSLDNFVENTHFSSEYFSAEDIGWKALAVNISDIAAMAGQPLYAMVGLSLNKSLSDKEKWVKFFYQGMQDCADNFGGLKVIGGDISSQSGFTTISVAIVGKSSKALLRSAPTKKNYKVCVTGKFGNSKSFLDNYQAKLPINPEDKIYHLRPRPRVLEAQMLEKQALEGALMDASDGLAASLYTLAEMNHGSIEIDSALIPRDKHVSLEQALYGGEDYELVGLFENCPEGFAEIGVITYEDKSHQVYDKCLGQVIDKSKQYQHF